MVEIEDIKWQLNVAESMLELEVRQRAALSILISKGVMTIGEFNDVYTNLKNNGYFKEQFDLLKERREEVEKYKDFDLGDLFNILGGRKQ